MKEDIIKAVEQKKEYAIKQANSSGFDCFEDDELEK